jgi:hypothetical protein
MRINWKSFVRYEEHTVLPKEFEVAKMQLKKNWGVVIVPEVKSGGIDAGIDLIIGDGIIEDEDWNTLCSIAEKYSGLSFEHRRRKNGS